MKYSTKLGDKICKATAKSSIGLRHICAQLKVPYSTVTSWIYDPQHELHGKYMQAKQLQLHCLAQEILEMVDDMSNDYVEVIQNGKKKKIFNRENISRTRLRMQARIAIITKLAPVLYGAKPEKTKHKVIMPEPPKQKSVSPLPSQTPQQIKNDECVTPPHSSQSPEERRADHRERPSSPKNTPKPAPIADRDEQSRQAGIKAIEDFEREQEKLRSEIHKWVNKR